MPARLRDLMRIAAHFEVVIEPPAGGSHYKARRPGCRVYPIPAHNGERTQIPDEYIRGLCRNFGIDYAEMKRLLSQ